MGKVEHGDHVWGPLEPALGALRMAEQLRQRLMEEGEKPGSEPSET